VCITGRTKSANQWNSERMELRMVNLSTPLENNIILFTLKYFNTHWIKINRKVACHNFKHFFC
jgi:hypothetical protein